MAAVDFSLSIIDARSSYIFQISGATKIMYIMSCRLHVPHYTFGKCRLQRIMGGVKYPLFPIVHMSVLKQVITAMMTEQCCYL